MVKTTPKSVKKHEQQKRVSNMNRDMEKYALLGFTESPKETLFTLVNIRDNKTIKVKIKSKKDVNCNCFDWKIRCKKNEIICKHICYVLTQILRVDIKEAARNRIKNYNKLSKGFKNIKINYSGDKVDFTFKEDKELTSEDLCPICYVDFLTDEKSNIINCFKCKGVIHKDCMLCWLNNAVNKTCVYCRDPGVKLLMNQ